MFAHVPYSDDEATYQLLRLQVARGHASALNSLGVVLVAGGVLCAAAAASVSGSLFTGASVLLVPLLTDLARGHWSRELRAHLDAGIFELQMLDQVATDALSRECGRHPLSSVVLERWNRQRYTLRQRDARALTELLENESCPRC